MKRRTSLTTSGITLDVLTLGKNLVASILAQDSYKIKMLTGKLWVFTEKGGTTAFLLPDISTNEGIIVVDSQFVEPAKHLITELKKKSLLNSSITFNCLNLLR